jgi:protease YdgD
MHLRLHSQWQRTMTALPALTLAAISLVIGPAFADQLPKITLQPPVTLTPIAIFGADDRVALPPRFQRIQEALGVLFNIRSRTVCTAFCVAENMVATASHCLFKTSGEQPAKLPDFWFARNYDTLRDYARIAGHNIGSAAQNVLAGTTRLSVAPPIDATSDWALIRLSRPVCNKGVLPVQSMTVNEIVEAAAAKRIFQIAYHRDFTQWRAAYSKPCHVSRNFETADWKTISADFSRPETLLLHTCDTGGASSGSPLLLEASDGPRVVAINVGTYVQSKVVMSEGKVTQRLKPDTIANTGVAAAAFASRLAAFRAASILMTANEIKELQSRLSQRGLYAGPIDGTYGPALKDAIELFEVQSRQAATGIASAAVLKLLREIPIAAKR